MSTGKLIKHLRILDDETDPEKLSKLLDGFKNGQFEIVNDRDNLHFRGKFSSFEISTNPDRRHFALVVTFEWLCEERLILHDHGTKTYKYKWSEVPKFRNTPQKLRFDFVSFYYQDDKNRIKMNGGESRETARFFKEDDITTITKNGDEYTQAHRVIERAETKKS